MGEDNLSNLQLMYDYITGNIVVAERTAVPNKQPAGIYEYLNETFFPSREEKQKKTKILFQLRSDEEAVVFMNIPKPNEYENEGLRAILNKSNEAYYPECEQHRIPL